MFVTPVKKTEISSLLSRPTLIARCFEFDLTENLTLSGRRLGALSLIQSNLETHMAISFLHPKWLRT